MTRTWLVSSGGRRGALVKILQRDGARVIVTDMSPLSAAGQLADGFELVPRISDEAFVPTMLRLAECHGVDTIVPTLDPELHVYARHRDQFRAIGTRVLVSAPEVTAISWDKWHFHQWLVAAGLPTVDTYERSGFDPGVLDGPVVAKPRNGSSSIGVVFADRASALPLERMGDEYIIQSRAPGVELTVDFAVGADGRFLGAVPRRRLEVRAGEVSKAVTVRVPEVEERARAFATTLPGPFGILNTQVFFDPETRHSQIIELNARVGGGYPLSDRAGADFFAALDSGKPVTDWEDGLVMVRYDEAAFFASPGYGL